MMASRNAADWSGTRLLNHFTTEANGESINRVADMSEPSRDQRLAAYASVRKIIDNSRDWLLRRHEAVFVMTSGQPSWLAFDLRFISMNFGLPAISC